MATKTKLEQTKGLFKLVGTVKGLENENALREDVTKNDVPYKALSFFIETTPTNAIKVEIFGMERDHVYAYSSKDKETKKIDWEDRHEDHSPYKVIGVGMGLEKDGKGKNVQKMMVEFDAVDYILENLKDGDSVFVQGQIDYQQYQDQQGNWKESKRFNIQRISKTKDPVDFEAEDFKPMNNFEQEIVVTETDVVEKKLIVNAKIIDYRGDHVDTQFVVDGEKYGKLAKNMKKRFKYGDFIKVFGLCINMVELEESDEVVDEDDDWGGDDEVKKSMQNNFVRNYIQELQIVSVDSSTYEPKKYTEEDFFNEDESNFGDDEFADDDFGDEFEDEGDFEEDLPFGKK